MECPRSHSSLEVAHTPGFLLALGVVDIVEAALEPHSEFHVPTVWTWCLAESGSRATAQLAMAQQEALVRHQSLCLGAEGGREHLAEPGWLWLGRVVHSP